MAPRPRGAIYFSSPQQPMPDHTIPDDAFTRELQTIGTDIGNGRLQQAAQALNKIQRQAPLDARVPLLGVRLANAAGNLGGATQAAQRALELAPDWPVALMELALALTRQGQAEQAMPHARKAVRLAPQDLQVLPRAVAVAAQAKASKEAIAWAQAAQQLQPGNLVFPIFLGQYLMHDQDYVQARTHFDRVLDVDPQNVLALRGALSCALETKSEAEAIALADRLVALQPDDEDVRYFHALAHRQMPATQPRSVVTSLFDSYAPRFDLHLVRGLEYKVPERAAQIITELHPDRRFNLLDLGCGTGLLGVYLGRIDGHLIGVDLSGKMIEQAARHGLYSRFHQVNLLDALRDTPADHYEVIACLDALIYVGELAPVIPNALRILKPGGHFVFSCETAEEDEADMVLRGKSQRYAHKASYVERLCREAGFDEVRIEHLPALRMEAKVPLPGYIVVARKPVATH